MLFYDYSRWRRFLQKNNKKSHDRNTPAAPESYFLYCAPSRPLKSTPITRSRRKTEASAKNGLLAKASAFIKEGIYSKMLCIFGD
jgi:hypothetical protein